MSSISSTLGSGISQFLQNLTSNGTSSPNPSAGSTTSTASHHHHHHAGGFEKLANAVTSALQAATTTSNGGSGPPSTDANQTITDALTKIFKNGSLGGSNDGDASDPASNNASTGTTGTTSTTSSLPASFAQTLQSFGVTAKQFESDLAAAFKNAQQSGSADLSTAFKSFPPGSLVDTVG